MCIYPKTCTTYHDSFLMITKLLLPKPTKRGHFSAVCRKKNFGPRKKKTTTTNPLLSNVNFVIFNSVAALIWQEKKGRKKVAINSFQKKSIISIMKKRRKITAFVREEKENEKKIP